MKAISTTTTFRVLAVAAMAALLAASLSACGLPGAQPAAQLYTLTPKSTFKKEMDPVTWQLAVDFPIAPSGLNSPRIAVVRDPLMLDYYADAQWVDNAPSMVQRLLIESFENSGKIIGVGRAMASLRSDYVLQSELREFQAEYYNSGDGPPKIRVRVNTKMIKLPERKIIASATFERLLDAPGKSFPRIVETFDDALGKVMRDIVTWALTTPKSLGY